MRAILLRSRLRPSTFIFPQTGGRGVGPCQVLIPPNSESPCLLLGFSTFSTWRFTFALRSPS
jgi:hypothetical protein